MNPLTEGKRITLGYDYFAKGFTGPQLSEAYYLLSADKEQERLLFETATMDQVDEAYNPGDFCDENDRMMTEEMVMEAIRIQHFARTESKMTALVRVFNGFLQDKNIEAQAPIVGNPKKSGLFATVTVQIPFSDGQVVSIVFHSPDNNKMKITADDEIIAFRWLLNKRDITHVVSPEGDAEVSLQEIGKRTAQLVEKNSARFQVMQKDLVAQKKKLEELKAQAEEAVKQHDELMGRLKDSQDNIEATDAKIVNLKDRIAKQKSFNDDLQGKIDALQAKQAGNDGKAAGGSTPKTEEEMKAEQEWAAYEEKRAALGSELTGRGFVDNGMGGVWNKEGFGYVQASGVEGYTITVGLAEDGSKKDFSSATLAGLDTQIKKALAWIDKKIASMKKGEAANPDPNAGGNTLKEIAAIPEGWSKGSAFDNRLEYGNGKYQTSVLSRSEGDNAFRVSLSEGNQVISWKDAKTIDEANGYAVDMMQNAEALKAAYLEEIKKTEPVVAPTGPTALIGPTMEPGDEQRILTELSSLSREELTRRHDEVQAYMKGPDYEGQDPDYKKSLQNTEFLLFTAKSNAPDDQQQPADPAEGEPAYVGRLKDILAGSYDNDSTKLGVVLDLAAAEIEAEGKAAEYDALLNQAADHLTEVLKKEAA